MKTILITGTSRGVGLELAKYYLHYYNVIGLDKSETGITNPDYKHIVVDLSRPEDILKIFKSIEKIDIVINNAAVLTSQFAIRLPLEKAIEMIMVDFLGVFAVSREAVKRMDRGRIINISSMAVVLEPMGDSIYAGCKAAVKTMANVMAKEFSQQGITCNTIGITAIETDMLHQLPKDKIDNIINRLTVPRYAWIEDIINVIDFFISDRSDYITAQTIYLGGIHD